MDTEAELIKALIKHLTAAQICELIDQLDMCEKFSHGEITLKRVNNQWRFISLLVSSTM